MSAATVPPGVWGNAYAAGRSIAGHFTLVDVQPGDSSRYRLAFAQIGPKARTIFDEPHILVSLDDGAGRWTGFAWRGTESDIGRIAELLAPDPWTAQVVGAVMLGWLA